MNDFQKILKQFPEYDNSATNEIANSGISYPEFKELIVRTYMQDSEASGKLDESPFMSDMRDEYLMAEQNGMSGAEVVLGKYKSQVAPKTLLGAERERLSPEFVRPTTEVFHELSRSSLTTKAKEENPDPSFLSDTGTALTQGTYNAGAMLTRGLAAGADIVGLDSGEKYLEDVAKGLDLGSSKNPTEYASFEEASKNPASFAQYIVNTGLAANLPQMAAMIGATAVSGGAGLVVGGTMAMGDITGKQRSATGEINSVASLPLAALYTMIDRIIPSRVASRLTAPEKGALLKGMAEKVTDPKFVASFLKRYGKEAGSTYATEATSEGLQALIAEAGVLTVNRDHQVITNESTRGILEEAFLGGFPGSGTSVASLAYQDLMGSKEVATEQAKFTVGQETPIGKITAVNPDGTVAIELGNGQTQTVNANAAQSVIEGMDRGGLSGEKKNLQGKAENEQVGVTPLEDSEDYDRYERDDLIQIAFNLGLEPNDIGETREDAIKAIKAKKATFKGRQTEATKESYEDVAGYEGFSIRREQPKVEFDVEQEPVSDEAFQKQELSKAQIARKEAKQDKPKESDPFTTIFGKTDRIPESDKQTVADEVFDYIDDLDAQGGATQDQVDQKKLEILNRYAKPQPQPKARAKKKVAPIAEKPKKEQILNMKKILATNSVAKIEAVIESDAIDGLSQKNQDRVLKRYNQLLKREGQEAVSALPPRKAMPDSEEAMAGDVPYSITRKQKEAPAKPKPVATRDDLGRPLTKEGKVDWEKSDKEQQERFSTLDGFIDKTDSVEGLESIVKDVEAVNDPNPEWKDPVMAKLQDKIEKSKKRDQDISEKKAFDKMSTEEKIAKLKNDVVSIEQYHISRNDSFANAKLNISKDKGIQKKKEQIKKLESSLSSTKELVDGETVVDGTQKSESKSGIDNIPQGDKEFKKFAYQDTTIAELEALRDEASSEYKADGDVYALDMMNKLSGIVEFRKSREAESKKATQEKEKKSVPKPEPTSDIENLFNLDESFDAKNSSVDKFLLPQDENTAAPLNMEARSQPKEAENANLTDILNEDGAPKDDKAKEIAKFEKAVARYKDSVRRLKEKSTMPEDRKQAAIKDFEQKAKKTEEYLDELKNPELYDPKAKDVDSDSYTGKRYTYGMTLRPADINTTPKGGQINGAYDSTDDRARHGSVQYTRKLTQAEQEKWSMIPLVTEVTHNISDGPKASPKDYHIREAEEAFQHSNRSGGKASRERFVSYINENYSDLDSNLNPEQKKELDSRFKALKSEYLEKEKSSVFPSVSATASSHIAGRNKFNSAQAESRGKSSDKALANFEEWKEDKISNIKRAIDSKMDEDQIKAVEKKGNDRKKMVAAKAFAFTVASMAERGSTKSSFRKILAEEWDTLSKDRDNAEMTLRVISKSLEKDGLTLDDALGKNSNIAKEIRSFTEGSKDENAVQEVTDGPTQGGDGQKRSDSSEKPVVGRSSEGKGKVDHGDKGLPEKAGYVIDVLYGLKRDQLLNLADVISKELGIPNSGYNRNHKDSISDFIRLAWARSGKNVIASEEHNLGRKSNYVKAIAKAEGISTSLAKGKKQEFPSSTPQFAMYASLIRQGREALLGEFSDAQALDVMAGRLTWRQLDEDNEIFIERKAVSEAKSTNKDDWVFKYVSAKDGILRKYETPFEDSELESYLPANHTTLAHHKLPVSDKAKKRVLKEIRGSFNKMINAPYLIAMDEAERIVAKMETEVLSGEYQDDAIEDDDSFFTFEHSEDDEFSSEDYENLSDEDRESVDALFVDEGEKIVVVDSQNSIEDLFNISGDFDAKNSSVDDFLLPQDGNTGKGFDDTLSQPKEREAMDLSAILNEDGEDKTPEPEPELAKEVPVIESITLAEIDDLRKKLMSGDLKAEEVKASIMAIMNNEESLKAELSKKTVAQLSRLVNYPQGMKKAELVKDVYGGMILTLYPKSMYSHSGDIKKSMMKDVENITDEKIEAYIAESKKWSDDMAAEIKEIKNPTTLKGFRDRARYIGNSGLSVEQKRLYDSLIADEAMIARRENSIKKATLRGDTDGIIWIEKGTGLSRTGEEMIVLQTDERLGDRFKEMASRARQLGGYFKNRVGFHLPKDKVKEFTGEVEDDKAEERAEERIQSRQEKSIERLEAMANKLNSDAEDSLGADRKTNTAKRAREAASAERSALKDKQTAKTLQNIIDGIKSGDVKYLNDLSAMTQLAELERITQRAMWKADRELKRERTQAEISGDVKKDPVLEDIDYAEMPARKARYHVLDEVSTFFQNKPGLKLISNKIKKWLKSETPDTMISLSESQYATVAELVKKVKKSDRDNWSLKELIEDVQESNRVGKMGITKAPILRAALREYLTFRDGEAKVDPIKEKERALIGRKIDGYFPTPKLNVSEMIEIADIQPGDTILEPSAGKGNIADQIREAAPDNKLEVIEINHSLRSILEDKGHYVADHDFMDFDPSKGGYDKIIMNPPFEKGQDIDHVMRAFDMLADGGRVVAITSEGPFFRQDKKAEAFREFVDKHGHSEKMEEGSFLTSERSTGVRTRIVVLDKPKIEPKDGGQGGKMRSRPLDNKQTLVGATPESIKGLLQAMDQLNKSDIKLRIVREGKGVEGDIDENGVVTINLDEVTGKDMPGLLVHEDFVHVMLKVILGEKKYDKLFDDVQAQIDSKEGDLYDISKSVVEAYKKDKLTKKQFIDEVIANWYQMEHANLQPSSAYRNLVNDVTRWFRANFKKERTTVADIKSDLDKAFTKYLASDRSGSSVVTEGNSDGNIMRSRKIKLSPALERKLQSEQLARANNPTPFGQRMKNTSASMGALLRQGVLDRFAPLKAIDSSDLIYRLNRSSIGTSTTISSFLEDGAIGWDGFAPIVKTKGEGFIAIAKKLGEKKMQQYLYYRMGKRAEDRKKNPNNAMTFTDPEIKELIAMGDDLDTATLDKQFNALNDSVLDFAVKAGLIHKDLRSKMSEEFYIPFYRVVEDEGIGGNIFSSSAKRAGKSLDNFIEEFVGGEKPIKDPLENIIKNWSTLIDQSIKNQAREQTMQRLMDLSMAVELVQTPKGVDAGTILEDGREYFTFTNLTDKNKERIVSHMSNGVRRHYRVEDEMMLAALTVTKPQLLDNWVMKALRFPKRTLTYGATFGAAFKVANVIRDVTSVALTHKKYNPISDTFKGMWGAMMQDKDYVEMMSAMGGFDSGYVNEGDAGKTAKKIRQRLQDRTILSTVGDLIRFWDSVGSAAENATRLGLYKRMRAEGDTRFDAAFSARDIMDFQLTGAADSVKILTAITPFLNARLQGLYKLGRSAQENPATLATGLAMVGAATIGLFQFRDEEKWKELKDWDKWTYWHFWIGGQHFRIPKPFELSVVPNMLEVAMEQMNGESDMKKAGQFAWHTISENFNLIDYPAAIKPLMEQWANKSFFTGSSIVPSYLGRLDPEAQSKPWTGTSLKMFGEATGISPLRAEHVLKAYGSTISEAMLTSIDFALHASDGFLGHPMGLTARPAMSKSEIPLFGRFIRSDIQRSTKYGDEYYRVKGEVDKAYATIRHFRRLGNFEQANEIANDNKWKLKLRGIGNSTDKRLDVLRKQAKSVWGNKNMTKQEKKRKLEDISKRQNEIQRKFYDYYIKLKNLQ